MEGLPSATLELNALELKHTIIQVEEKAAHVLVIHFPSSVCFILRNNLGRNTQKIVLDLVTHKLIKRIPDLPEDTQLASFSFLLGLHTDLSTVMISETLQFKGVMLGASV